MGTISKTFITQHKSMMKVIATSMEWYIKAFLKEEKKILFNESFSLYLVLLTGLEYKQGEIRITIEGNTAGDTYYKFDTLSWNDMLAIFKRVEVGAYTTLP